MLDGCSCSSALPHMDETVKIPHNIVTVMVLDTICEYRVAPLYGESLSSALDNLDPQKKSKQIGYDREQAKNSVIDDWFGHVLRFHPNKSVC